jgi:hypothetical protein
LVEVPIKVHTPPKIVAYDSGIRNLEGGRFNFSAQRFMTGAKMITTGVLFRKADNAEIGNMMDVSMRGIERCCLGSDNAANLLRIPEYRTPSLTKKSTPTVNMPLFENPAANSVGVIIPIAIKKTAPEKRINPGRMASFARATIIATTTVNTM